MAYYLDSIASGLSRYATIPAVTFAGDFEINVIAAQLGSGTNGTFVFAGSGVTGQNGLDLYRNGSGNYQLFINNAAAINTTTAVTNSITTPDNIIIRRLSGVVYLIINGSSRGTFSTSAALSVERIFHRSGWGNYGRMGLYAFTITSGGSYNTSWDAGNSPTGGNTWTSSGGQVLTQQGTWPSDDSEWVFYSTGGGAYTLNADGGTYSYSGGAVSLRLNRSLQAAGGSFSYAGGVATLTYTPAGVSYTLNADGGLFSYSGGNAALRINRKIQASGGAYSYSGGNAGLSRGYKVNAAGGVYGYSGGASTLDYVPATGYTLAALGASFSYAGGDATFNYSQTYPQAVASDFTVIGRLSDSANYSAIMYQSTTYSGRLN